MQASPCGPVKAQINTTDGYYNQGGYGASSSIAQDSTGRIWHAWFENDDIAPSSLYVAYSNDHGNTWIEELAVDDCNPDSSSPSISLMIDSGDVPHIIFVSDIASAGRIYHTIRTGGVWPGAAGGLAACTIIFTNDPGAGRHLYGMAACIDNNDDIHMAANDGWGGGHGTFYHKYTAAAGTWGAEVTVAAPQTNRVCQIVADSLGNPHVALCSGILLYHSADGGGSFGAYDVGFYAEATGVNASCFDMAIGTDDVIHFAFRFDNASPEEIRYVSGVEGAWGSAIVLATALDIGDRWYGPLLALDTSNDAYIIYQLNVVSVTVDDGVYYVKVTGGVAGAPQIFVASADITYPGTGGYEMPSVISGFWQRYPGSSIQIPACCPSAILQDVNGQFGANVLFVRV